MLYSFIFFFSKKKLSFAFATIQMKVWYIWNLPNTKAADEQAALDRRVVGGHTFDTLGTIWAPRTLVTRSFLSQHDGVWNIKPS
jgi:hypothetical protein